MASAISAVTTSAPGTASRLKAKHLLFGFIASMYIYVLWKNESFLFNSKDPEWVHIESFKWWLLPHGLAAACALFLGPLQFSDRLRQGFAKTHRVMGRQGKVQQDKQRMTRSFACALIFVEVRVVLGLTGWEKYTEAIVWSCVAAAVPLADFVLYWQDLRRARPVPARAVRPATAAS